MELKSLKEVERKAYLSNFQDGLYDIAWAIWMFAWGMIPLMETSRPYLFLGLVLNLAPAIIIWVGKKYITIPRMGMAKFGPRRKSRLKWLFFATAGIAVCTSVLFILGNSSHPSHDFQAALGGYGIVLGIGLFITLIISTIAYFLDYGRMYLYGAILGLGLPLKRFLSLTADETTVSLIIFGIPAIGIIIIGMIMFIRFLRCYPKSVEKTVNQYSA